MSRLISPIAMFRLSVLGPLAIRARLQHGEITASIAAISAKPYNIPDSKRTHVSEATIARWYALWQKGGVEALEPKERDDKGSTTLAPEVQEALLRLKKDNISRSINVVIKIIEAEGLAARGSMARATVHRFLQNNHASKRVVGDVAAIERRSFVAEHAGDIWQGDVLHGPHIQTPTGLRKTYLVSLMDDAARLIAHSAFCFGEKALDIEGVLKQAILKRGLPHRLMIDNGAAYRSHSLQGICARLKIKLIYSRPWEPQSKGKIERFHRTFREQFLSELNLNKVKNIDDLNHSLHAWVETVYHERIHCGLDNQTPLQRWRQDINYITPVPSYDMDNIDDIFNHRDIRKVRNDGTVSWENKIYEVDHHLVGEKIVLVVNPHAKEVIRAESLEGKQLGSVFLLDKRANANRDRKRPEMLTTTHKEQTTFAVDYAVNNFEGSFEIPDITSESSKESL